ncbi:MAG TPA: nucleoside deaminase [Streptosporangiaceae bacterium]|nr:nucleoside deaminase [Streptosporangiaceae bacterium]
MRLALRLARERTGGEAAGGVAAGGEAAGSAGTDVPVGAVVLGPDGSVAGSGHNLCLATSDPTAHAEIVAIRQAATALGTWRLDDCTLVVTLEPCTMCAGAVHAARIRRVVYGATDPRAGAAGSLWDVLRDRRLGPPVEVVGGLLAEQCGQLLSEFFGRLR